MVRARSTRRDFLADVGRAGTSTWLSLHFSWVALLNGCARSAGPDFRLSPTEKGTLEAFAAQILPPDAGEPGAVGLGAVEFVDRTLGQPFFAADVPLVRTGLADLDARARALGERRGFAELPAPSQAAILRQIEETDFFKAARTLVLIGAFADPSHGGNRDGAGWTLLGMDHRPTYTAPFGYYDARSDA